MMRLILAIIFSPLMSSFFFSISEPIIAGRLPNLRLIIAITPIFYIFPLLGLVILGLPIYFLLKKLNILNLASLTITGGLTGIIYTMIFQLVIFPVASSTETIAFVPGFLMGAISALIFGLLAGISFSTKQRGLATK